ncbi:MAG: hypothetical protein L3K26_17320, partial [Candidatus Hydrogenedentes bacterium]|nr:hypothetical protein [Candidatus Hydrogenedentota bacterium]
YLLICLPLVCLAAFLQCSAEDGRDKWARHMVALCIPVGVFLLIVVVQSLVVDKVLLREQLAEYLGSFDFIPTRSRSVAKWHTIGFFEYLRGQRGNLSKRILEPTFLASLGPSLLVLLYFIHSSFRLRPFAWLSVVLLAVVGCPLAMHAIAWDTARISSYLLGGAFIAAWIFTETRKPQGAGDLFPLIALPVIVLNVFMRIPLMDGEVERFSDWQRLWLYSPAFILVLFTMVKNDELVTSSDSAVNGIPTISGSATADSLDGVSTFFLTVFLAVVTRHIWCTM